MCVTIKGFSKWEMRVRTKKRHYYKIARQNGGNTHNSNKQFLECIQRVSSDVSLKDFVEHLNN